MTDAPPLQPSDITAAQAVADHANVEYKWKPQAVPPTPKAQVTSVPEPEPSEAVAPVRRAYGEALLSGQVQGPQEFSQGHAGVSLGAARDAGASMAETAEDDPNKQVVAATQAAKLLASQLPTHEDFIDHAIAVTADEGIAPTAANIDVTKQNMIDHWADTGLPPAQQYAQAQKDKAFAEALVTQPPAPPTPPPPPFTSIPLDAMRWIGDPEAKVDPEIAKWEADPAVQHEIQRLVDIDKPVEPVSMVGEPVQHHSLREDLEDLGITIATVAAGGYVLKAAGEVIGSAIKSETGQYILKGMGHLLADETGAINFVAAQYIKRAFMTPQQIANRALSKAAQFDVQVAIRSATGNSVREQEVAKAALEGYRKALGLHIDEYTAWIKSGFTPGSLWPVRQGYPVIAHLLDYIEGRSTMAEPPNPAIHPFLPLADALRAVYQEVKTAIQTEIPDMSSFIEDYYRHMWKDNRSLWQIIRTAGRQGSGASLQKRTIPTMYEGIQGGLIPKILDPIDNTLHYVQGMRDYLAQHHVLELGKEQGYVVQSVGSPGPGMSLLKGRGAEGAVKGVNLWAPNGYARSYNAWVGKGFYEWPLAGAVYDKVLFAANMMTGLKLALSGYHAWNIAQEAVVAVLSNAVGKLSRGDIIGGIKDFGLAPVLVPGRILASGATEKLVAPLPHVLSTGVRLQQQYLRTHDYGPGMEAMVQTFVDAGARFMGRGREYRVGMSKDFFQAWQRGSVLRELKQDIQSVMGTPAIEAPGFRAVMALPRFLGVAAQEIGRGMDTILSPLFDTAIPRVKLAAMADELEAWIAGHPNATTEARDQFARKLVDSMDNRFGEMVQDNLFWPRVIKQIMNVATVSVGWEYGSLRAFGLAGKDVLEKNVMALRTRWLMGFAMMTAIQASVYQYLRTGTLPEGKQWVTPLTGGKSPYGTPEMSLLPGYGKDALSIGNTIAHTLDDPVETLPILSQYALAKESPFLRTVSGFLGGKDWKGDDIRSRLHETATGKPPDWFDRTRWAMGDYAKMVMQQVTPINVENPRLKGSGLTEPERFLGLRPAPTWWSDPKEVEGAKAGHEKLLKGLEAGRERRAAQRQGIPVPSHRDNAPAAGLPTGADPGLAEALKRMKARQGSHP